MSHRISLTLAEVLQLWNAGRFIEEKIQGVITPRSTDLRSGMAKLEAVLMVEMPAKGQTKGRPKDKRR